VKTADDLRLPVPALAARPDGQRLPKTVLIPGSPELRAYVAELGDRAEKVRGAGVAPEEDNMLKITTDGRKAALDMRLVSGQAASGACKLDVAATAIAQVWRDHRDHTYSDSHTARRSPVTGALQIVFCDLSTPTSDGWNAYTELREQLTARGVPRERVRFIHEARNDAEKARQFEACRTGQVAVLVGSTEKMGVGTNIQHRCVALHHLDCPWRPADIEQREGRALRQGNQNPEIEIYRYAVEGSFDAYSWQTVERKARFINGWQLHPDSWGQGFASEAASAVLERGFADGLPEVWAVMYPDNDRSVAVCRRIGMRLLGTTHCWYHEPSLMFWAGARPGQRPSLEPDQPAPGELFEA
jgi:hypothetical protein